MIAHRRSAYRGEQGWLIYGSHEGRRVRIFVPLTMSVAAVLANVKAGRRPFEGVLA
jgi:hypothetical protein